MLNPSRPKIYAADVFAKDLVPSNVVLITHRYLGLEVLRPLNTFGVVLSSEIHEKTIPAPTLLIKLMSFVPVETKTIGRSLSVVATMSRSFGTDWDNSVKCRFKKKPIEWIYPATKMLNFVLISGITGEELLTSPPPFSMIGSYIYNKFYRNKG